MTCFPEIDVGFFFNLPFSLPPPCDEQKSSRMTSEVPVPTSAGPWSAPAAPFLWGPVAAETPAPEELQEGGHIISEILGENHMPALLLTACHRLQETKLLSFPGLCKL